MPEPTSPQRRTGGRSARIRTAIHAAVDELLTESSALTVGAVADRAGVSPTSIYRRWGTLEALILDVEAERVRSNSPIPDSGSLRGDLLGYAHNAAHDITRPGGLAFLAAILATNQSGALHSRDPASPDGSRDPLTAAPLEDRGVQIQAMLDRAHDRGEPLLHQVDVLDGILAPIYLRTILGIAGLDRQRLAMFVDRTLSSADTRPHRRRSILDDSTPKGTAS